MNWWGNASGPYHATLNPTGTGGSVSDYVDFDPWLGGGVGALRHAQSPLGLAVSARAGSVVLQLPRAGALRIEFYDMNGRRVGQVQQQVAVSGRYDVRIARAISQLGLVAEVTFDGVRRTVVVPAW
jgi:hypothetical protein